MDTGNEENMWTLQNVKGNAYDTRDFAIGVLHQFTDRLNRGERDNGEMKNGGHEKYKAQRNRIYKVTTGEVSPIFELTSRTAPTLPRYRPRAWNMLDERCTEFFGTVTRSMTKLNNNLKAWIKITEPIL
jgi:hypothetical protein